MRRTFSDLFTKLYFNIKLLSPVAMDLLHNRLYVKTFQAPCPNDDASCQISMQSD